MTHHRNPIAALAVGAVLVVAALVWLMTLNTGSAPDTDVAVRDATGAPALRSAAVSEPQVEVTRSVAETPEPLPVHVPDLTPRVDELWGRVVRATDGTPIPGADVRLRHRDADEFWNLDLDYGKQIDELAQTVTDEDGRFRFDVARARQHRLHVQADGFAARTVFDCTGGSEIVVEMTAGATVEGIVRIGGVLAAGIPVRAVAGRGVELAHGYTERDGSFRFGGLQAGRVFVQVRPPENREEWKRLDLRAGAVHQVEVDIAEGRTLTGRVVDAQTREPIIDAEISDSSFFKRIVRSDNRGEFAIRGLIDGGDVELHVRATGYARASRNLAGALGEVAEFALVRGGEVSGRLLDGHGAPARPVYVAAGASFMAAPGVGSTDWLRGQVAQDGLFVVTDLRPDQHYWIYVRGAGFGTRVYALPRPVASGERIDVGDIVLCAAGGLEGRVIDDAGQPLAGQSVWIEGTNANSMAWVADQLQPRWVSHSRMRDLRTDRRGRFSATNLAAGSYEVGVQPQGRDAAISTTVEIADGTVSTGVELVVPSGEVIEGAIRRADGRPLGDEAVGHWLHATTAGGARYTSAIDADGKFRFTGLTPGSYEVSLTHGSSGWVLSPRADVRTGTTDLQLVLERAVEISGRVVDAEGAGREAHVWMRRAELDPGSPLWPTDYDGSFRLEVAPGFRGKLFARAVRSEDGGNVAALRFTQPAELEVVAGQRGVVLTLPRAK